MTDTLWEARMTGQTLAEMRAWCADVFSDMPGDATDAEVLNAVRRQYCGGVAGFIADGGY